MTDVYIKYMESKLREQSAEIERLRADVKHLNEVVGQQSARLEKQARSLAAVREFCEQQVKGRSGSSNDRDGFDLSYIDGWNDALDYVEQALDGGAK